MCAAIFGTFQEEALTFRAEITADISLEELFQYTERFKPQSISLDTKLKPFIPDYFPAVGDVDEFLKVPRPDGMLQGCFLSFGFSLASLISVFFFFR